MELDHRPAAARAEGPAIPWYSLQAGVDRQPDSLGLHLPAFQFRREELSTDSSTHLKKSPLSSASERCSAGYRVQFQRLKCSIREVRASGPRFRSSSCCAPNPCREIVQREETAASARRWHRSGQKVAAMAYPASAMQSKARRTLCLSGRTGPSRAAGDMGLPHLIILAAGPLADLSCLRLAPGGSGGGRTKIKVLLLQHEIEKSHTNFWWRLDKKSVFIWIWFCELKETCSTQFSPCMPTCRNAESISTCSLPCLPTRITLSVIQRKSRSWSVKN